MGSGGRPGFIHCVRPVHPFRCVRSPAQPCRDGSHGFVCLHARAGISQIRSLATATVPVMQACTVCRRMVVAGDWPGCSVHVEPGAWLLSNGLRDQFTEAASAGTQLFTRGGVDFGRKIDRHIIGES